MKYSFMCFLNNRYFSSYILANNSGGAVLMYSGSSNLGDDWKCWVLGAFWVWLHKTSENIFCMFWGALLSIKFLYKHKIFMLCMSEILNKFSFFSIGFVCVLMPALTIALRALL